MATRKKRAIDNQIFLLLEYGNQAVNHSYFTAKSFAENEFSEIVICALNDYFFKVRGHFHNWFWNFVGACDSISNLRNSITFLLNPQFKTLLTLLKDARNDRKQRVVDAVQNAIDGFKWDSKVLKGLENPIAIVSHKDKMQADYSKLFYLGSQRIDDYAERFSPLKNILKNEEFSKGDMFKEFSFDFMKFLLFRYLSSKSEKDLFGILLKDTHQKDLKDISGEKSLIECEIFVSYCKKKFDELEKEFFMQLMEKYPNLESTAETIMENAFFPQTTQDSASSEFESEAKGKETEANAIVSKEDTMTSAKQKIEAKPPIQRNLGPEGHVDSVPSALGVTSDAGPKSFTPSNLQNSDSETHGIDGTDTSDGTGKILGIAFSVVAVFLIACVIGFVIYKNKTKKG